MTPEAQQAREMGELTSSVKNTNIILERMEDKLDGAIETVSSHNTTIALLTRVSSENSGAIKALQCVVVGENGKDGLVREINELNKFKTQCELRKEENRKGFKGIFFYAIQWIVITVMAVVLGYHEIKNK